MNESREAPEVEERFRAYAWNYFELHAKQRLKAFQFFITLSTGLVGGFFLLLQFWHHKLLSVLGMLVVFLSFVFWKLDRRTSGLIKNAEDALKHLDGMSSLPDMEGMPHVLRLFDRDDFKTRQLEIWPLSSGHFSYTRSFRWVFVIFAVCGLGVGLACAALLPW